MNFIDALQSVELVLESDAVPLLIGESGIGKTALIKRLCELNNFKSVLIDGNMLKEGEIGGLPVIEDYSISKEEQKIIQKRTVYAIHTKLQEVQKLSEEKQSSKVLLFIDEINRCEHTVQQELMNIILNREINGYILPSNIKVVAAMNPSNKYEHYSESDYQVVDMDPAQENRFVWIEMEADVKEWINWGMESGNIHEDILAFISNFPEYLHVPYSNEMVKATPRSWERVSNTYKIYLARRHEIPTRIFLNVVKGNVGTSIAQEFYNFIENNKNPLIKPEEIFSENKIGEDLIKRVKLESHSRLYMAAKNALNYIKNSNNKTEEIELFSHFIQAFPPDLKLAVMKEIKEKYEKGIYKEFLVNKTFIDGFFQIYNELEG